MSKHSKGENTMKLSKLIVLAFAVTLIIFAFSFPVTAAAPGAPLMIATINWQEILTIIGGLVGLPALWSVFIDILKLCGVVNDGNAPKWNAGFSIALVVLVAIAVNFFPNFDIAKADSLFGELSQFLAYIVALVAQVVVAKATHAVTSRVFPALSFSRRLAMKKK
jgi:hypothetical protein